MLVSVEKKCYRQNKIHKLCVLNRFIFFSFFLFLFKTIFNSFKLRILGEMCLTSWCYLLGVISWTRRLSWLFSAFVRKWMKWIAFYRKIAKMKKMKKWNKWMEEMSEMKKKVMSTIALIFRQIFLKMIKTLAKRHYRFFL